MLQGLCDGIKWQGNFDSKDNDKNFIYLILSTVGVREVRDDVCCIPRLKILFHRSEMMETLRESKVNNPEFLILHSESPKYIQYLA